MKKLLYLLLPILFWSCSDNEDDFNQNEQIILPEKIHIRFLSEGYLNIIHNEFVKIKYSKQNNLPEEILGDINESINGSFGFQSYNPYKYEEYQYNGNKVLRLIKNTENTIIEPIQVLFTLEKNKIISSEEYYYGNINGNKTYNRFTYNNNKLHKKIIYWFRSDIGKYADYGIEYQYFFNDKNNLDSIVSQNIAIDQNLNSSYDVNRFNSKTVKVLKNYDSSKNPFKQLFLFDRFFDRSLSTNNYTQVIEKGYAAGKLSSYNKFDIIYFYENNEVDLTR